MSKCWTYFALHLDFPCSCLTFWKLISMQSSVRSIDIKVDNPAALYERLRILRYVNGVSETVKWSIVQLQHLWQLCDIPADREEIMVFVSHASFIGDFTELEAAIARRPQGQNDSSLSSAFSDEVRTSAFLDLFCSQAVSWDDLGEGAYKSFYLMFKKLRQSPAASLTASGPALDSLWRICLLTAGNENVAAQSMKDLLAVVMWTIVCRFWTDADWQNRWLSLMKQHRCIHDSGLIVRQKHGTWYR